MEPSAPDLDALLPGIVAEALPPGPHEMVLRAADGSHRSVKVHLRPVKDIAFEGFVVTRYRCHGRQQLTARLESTGDATD